MYGKCFVQVDEYDVVINVHVPLSVCFIMLLDFMLVYGDCFKVGTITRLSNKLDNSILLGIA